MPKWPMRGHFRYLRFKTFPMTPRTPQCRVFWAFLLSSKHSGVPEDSKSLTLGVGISSSHFTQSRVATWSYSGTSLPYINISTHVCNKPAFQNHTCVCKSKERMLWAHNSTAWRSNGANRIWSSAICWAHACSWGFSYGVSTMSTTPLFLANVSSCSHCLALKPLDKVQFFSFMETFVNLDRLQNSSMWSLSMSLV